MKEEYFWARVDKTEDCWLWTGATRRGYGIGTTRENGKAVGFSAHRYSYELHNGPIENGNHVLHICDVPNCVNPAHLRQGTHQDNMDDMREKGRGFNQALVEELRRRAADGESAWKLSQEYDLNYYAMLRAIRGESHLKSGVPPFPIENDKPRKRKLSLEAVAEIEEALKTPYWGINDFLSRKYGVHPSAISQIKKGIYLRGVSPAK